MMMMMSLLSGSDDPKNSRKLAANLRRRVNVDVAYTHSVNYEEPIIDEQELRGSLFQVDDDTYILAFDSVIAGTTVTNTLKLQADTLSWVIIGNTHARQTFKEGEWYSNQFFVDGNTLMCRNKCRRMDSHFNDDGGFIDLFYELYSGDAHLGHYSLEVYIH